MPKKLEENRDEVPENAPERNSKKTEESSAGDFSDLRALLLILVLTVIVFFILLYKQKHPEDYAKSVIQAKENADAAYSKAEEVLPKAYRGLGGFFEYVSDYGKESELPPALPKAVIASWSAVAESAASVPDSGSGALSATGSSSSTWAEVLPESRAEPLVVEFSGYRLEFDRPPSEPVTLEVAWSKMTVGPASDAKTSQLRK